MEITDPRMIRVLLREQTLKYLAPLLATDRSVAEVAALVQEPLPRTHHHVRSFHDAGLVRVVSETPRKGRAIKRYQAIAQEFVIPAALLPHDLHARQMERINAELTRSFAQVTPEWVLGGDVRIYAPTPTRGSIDRLYPERAGDTVPNSRDHALQTVAMLRLNSEDAAELRDELAALRDKWIARSRDGTDLPHHTLSLAMVRYTR